MGFIWNFLALSYRLFKAFTLERANNSKFSVSMTVVIEI
jgi:hypothetical protein